MTEQEYIDRLAGPELVSAPHDFIKVGGEKRLRILDLSQIPGADRKYFDEQGIWKGDAEVKTESKSKAKAQSEEKLPANFPGSALIKDKDSKSSSAPSTGKKK